MNERERIQRLARIFGLGKPASDVSVGIGDDAAVFAANGESIVLSVDSQVEGVHFRTTWLSWEDVGYRATMAALSDLAAMGVKPRGVFCALCMPEPFADESFEAIARGQQIAATELDTRVLGGNMARASEVSLHTTVVGSAPADGVTGAIARDGARPGHVLYVAGRLGLSGLGCRALMTNRGNAPGIEEALAAFRRPRARIEDGLRACAASVAAMIDVSDGLSLDASRMAEASGVRFVFDRVELLHANDQTIAVAQILGEDPLAMILGGGEDFALLAASASPPDGFIAIGNVAEGEGVWLDDVRIEATGHDHFARG